MRLFNSAVAAYFVQLESLQVLTAQLSDALAADDSPLMDAVMTEHAVTVQRLRESLERMDAQYRSFHADTNAAVATVTRSQRLEPVTLTAWALFAAGSYLFASKMKSLSDQMTEQRKEREAAEADLMNAKNGAEERVATAKAKMKATGEAAITEVVSRVTTRLVLDPVKTATVGGAVLKFVVAGEARKAGIRVLSATGGCASADGAACKLGATQTDAEGRAKVPAAPDVSLVLSAPELEPRGIDKVAIEEGKDTDIDVEVDALGAPAKAPTSASGTWIVCSGPGVLGCVTLHQDLSTFEAKAPVEKNEACSPAGYTSYYKAGPGYFTTDAGCRANCRELASVGDLKCETPP